MDDETVWIDVEGPLKTTPKAYLFDTEAGETWVPKSQLGAIKGHIETGVDRIEVNTWWAKKHGLADEKDAT